MTEAELTLAIEATKSVVFQALRRHLSRDLAHLAEDVAQETYLRFYLTFRKKNALPDSELSRWLYVVTRNECRRVGQKSRGQDRLVRGLERNFHTQTSDAVNEEEPGLNEKEVLKYIRHLPEPYREAVTLRSRGMDLKLIGKRTGVKTGTVKSRLSRGKEMLSRMMANEKRSEEGYEKRKR